jgi:PKD repeat protein
MPAPKANFYFENKELLKIKCRDLSNDSSTPPVSTWSWNFGDGSPVNTTQNPEHTYSAPGIYLLSLTVTNADGQSIKSTYITLDDDKFIITLPIIELVRYKIPSNLFDYLNIINLIQKWQLHLQPQINPEPIPDANVFDETKWPSLVNSLIADLTVFDILMNTLDQMVATSGGTVPTGSGGSSEINVPNRNGNLKLVETGPSKTEWFNQQESSAGWFKAVMANSSTFVPELKSRLCMSATRLRITLPFCQAENINFLFKKAGLSEPPTFDLVKYYPTLLPYHEQSVKS